MTTSSTAAMRSGPLPSAAARLHEEPPRQSKRPIFALVALVKSSTIGKTKAADEQVFLQAMYKEHCDQARQHEALRQQSTTLVFALAGTIAAAAGVVLSATLAALVKAELGWVLYFYALFGVFIMLLAFSGRRLSLRHYERNEMHREFSWAYRRRLEDMFPDSDYKRMRADVLRDHHCNWTKEAKGRNAKVSEIKAWRHWASMYSYLVVFGALLALLPPCLAYFSGSFVQGNH